MDVYFKMCDIYQQNLSEERMGVSIRGYYMYKYHFCVKCGCCAVDFNNFMYKFYKMPFFICCSVKWNKIGIFENHRESGRNFLLKMKHHLLPLADVQREEQDPCLWVKQFFLLVVSIFPPAKLLQTTWFDKFQAWSLHTLLVLLHE